MSTILMMEYGKTIKSGATIYKNKDWYAGHTNSNNSDEIILHRVGHDYSNTIYLRTKESPTPGYAKLQISANTNLLHEHIYTFKFKRIC